MGVNIQLFVNLSEMSRMSPKLPAVSKLLDYSLNHSFDITKKLYKIYTL